jgi:hypothetical protein
LSAFGKGEGWVYTYLYATLACEDEGLSLRLVWTKCFGKPRLAHTGLSPDEYEATAFGERGGEVVAQHAQLALSTEEQRLRDLGKRTAVRGWRGEAPSGRIIDATTVYLLSQTKS